MAVQTTAIATSCLIGKFVQGKTAPNTNLVHTPPSTGKLPKFFGEGSNHGKVKK